MMSKPNEKCSTCYVVIDVYSSRSKRILSFDKINQWVMQGRYARLDQLQKDILMLFQQARLSEADSDNESEKIIVLLEKEYVRIRDKICSSLLWSPAYEERTLQLELCILTLNLYNTIKAY